MDKWLTGSFAAAALLAGAGVLYHYVFAQPRAERPEPSTPHAAARMDQCRQAAQLLYDVTWASACMTVAIQEKARHAACLEDTSRIPDPALRKAHCDHQHGEAEGISDCSLPNEHAAMVNAALREAEDRCTAEQRSAKSR